MLSTEESTETPFRHIKIKLTIKSRIDACCSQINSYSIPDRKEIIKLEFKNHLIFNFVYFPQI